MSGFKFRKSLDGNPAPVSLEFIGKNSVEFQIGDLVRINTAGFCDVSDSGEEIVGVVEGVVDKNGINVDPDSASTPDVFTMASDNQTVAQKRIKVCPALPQYLFYNDTDGSLAQSNLLQYADVANANQVTTGGLTDTATAQVRLIQLDPDNDGDASKGLFQIVESQLVGISKGNQA